MMSMSGASAASGVSLGFVLRGSIQDRVPQRNRERARTGIDRDTSANVSLPSFAGRHRQPGNRMNR
jgi:hypothetical protein